MNESQLLRKACQGDGPAVRALYERYAPRVYAVVRRIAADDDLAQDYAQEAWIRAIRALPTFRGEARFSTWLHRIAVNSALQAVRGEQTRHSREAPMPEAIAVVPPARDALLSQKLEWALDRLPERMRKVLTPLAPRDFLALRSPHTLTPPTLRSTASPQIVSVRAWGPQGV